MVRFSIIIPHKDIPKLAKRCIDSIPNREDIQIIIVDDGSESRNLDDLKEIIEARTNVILLINKVSMGSGAARNIGLKHAIGKWVLFADSDDFYHEELFDFLNDYYDSNKDLIIFNADCIMEDTGEKSWRADHVHNFIEEYKNDKENGELNLRYLFGAPWCKMVKMNIVKKHNILFDETKIRNDVRFSYLVGYYAKEIAIDERIIYCYVDRIGSLSKTMSEEKSLDEFKVFSQWYYFLHKKTPIKKLDRFEYSQYVMSQDLYKRPLIYLKKIKIMQNIGYSLSSILLYTIKNLLRTFSIKVKYLLSR